jgi:hypothetical protein
MVVAVFCRHRVWECYLRPERYTALRLAGSGAMLMPHTGLSASQTSEFGGSLLYVASL